MNILVPIILHVAIQNVFEWAYCAFCKCCFRVTHCGEYSIPSALQNFLNSPANSVPSYTQILFGLLFLVISFENVFLFPSSLLSSFPLHLRFCQTSLGELINTLHHCLLPIYQHMLDPYTKIHLWISQRLSFFWSYVLLVWT